VYVNSTSGLFATVTAAAAAPGQASALPAATMRLRRENGAGDAGMF
jgi:hypothetical protein